MNVNISQKKKTLGHGWVGVGDAKLLLRALVDIGHLFATPIALTPQRCLTRRACARTPSAELS